MFKFIVSYWLNHTTWLVICVFGQKSEENKKNMWITLYYIFIFYSLSSTFYTYIFKNKDKKLWKRSKIHTLVLKITKIKQKQKKKKEKLKHDLLLKNIHHKQNIEKINKYSHKKPTEDNLMHCNVLYHAFQWKIIHTKQFHVFQ